MPETTEPTVRMSETTIPSVGQQSQAENQSEQASATPGFVSTRRLQEIFSSNPALSSSPEAQAYVVQQMVNQGYEIEGLNARFSFGDFAKNWTPDVIESAEGLKQLFLNPFQAAEGLSSIARGVLRKVLPEAIFYPGAKLRQALPEALGGTDLTPAQQAERDNQALGIVGDMFLESFGSFDRVLNTIEKHPAQFVSTVATLTAGAGLKAAEKGAKLGLLSARAAADITKTAEMINRLNYVSDPISIATGAYKVTALPLLKKANEALGVTKILKDADVNERMLQGLGLTGSQRVRLASETKVAKGGELLAKWGVTGTLDEMSDRLGKINQASDQTIKNTLKRLDKPAPPKPEVPTRTPPEIDADILKRTEELERQGATAEQLANDPILKQLDEESLAAYSQNAKPTKVVAPQPTTFKINAANNALDQMYDLRKSGTENLADLVAPADQKIFKNLALSDKEIYQIVNKTQTQAGDIGKRLVGMGVEPDDTYANISKKLQGVAAESQGKLDTALAGSEARFSELLTTKILNNLNRLKKGIPFKDLAEPIQNKYNRITKLLFQNKTRGLNLSEMNEVKRLIDNMADDKVFTQAGDIKTSNIAKNLGELRKELRSLIENKAAKSGVRDVRELNNITQFAQEVKGIVDKKIKSGLPKKEPTSTKFTSVEYQALRDELKELRQKSVDRGLSLSELNRVDDLIHDIGSTLGKGSKEKANLDRLQKNIRQVIDTQAKRRGVDNLEALRAQRDVSKAYKDVIDKKILAGGDKANARNIGKLATQTLFSEMLYRSKIGKVYGLLKGVRGFFQTIRSPQFERDMATAIQMLSDKDFAKLEGGLNISRAMTKTERKLINRAYREKIVNQHIEVMNKVLHDLSKLYPALRGIRLTGEALKNIRQRQKTEAELDEEPIVQSSRLTPQQVPSGATGSEFESADENLTIGGGQ